MADVIQNVVDAGQQKRGRGRPRKYPVNSRKPSVGKGRRCKMHPEWSNGMAEWMLLSREAQHQFITENTVKRRRGRPTITPVGFTEGNDMWQSMSSKDRAKWKRQNKDKVQGERLDSNMTQTPGTTAGISDMTPQSVTKGREIDLHFHCMFMQHPDDYDYYDSEEDDYV